MLWYSFFGLKVVWGIIYPCCCAAIVVEVLLLLVASY